MPVELQNNHPNVQTAASSEVTFHLAPPDPEQPFRRVAGISTVENAWQDRYIDAGTQLDEVAAILPDVMSERMLAFARRHIGPDATNQETTYYCHTFAEAVGRTAAESTIPEGGELRNYAGTTQASSIFQKGARIAPNELGIGEHGVIGDADENKPSTRTGVEHSMVGIGGGRAIQVDGPRAGQYGGHLYIGRPEDYIKWLEASHRRAPGLYVHRDSVVVPESQPGRVRRIGMAFRDRLKGITPIRV